MPDLNKIIEDLSKLTVAEAAGLSKKLEDLKGGLGITLDDVGAGVLTNILIQFMIY